MDIRIQSGRDTSRPNYRQVTVIPNSSIRAEVFYGTNLEGVTYTEDIISTSAKSYDILLSQNSHFTIIPQAYSNNESYNKPYLGCMLSATRTTDGRWIGYYMSKGVITVINQTADLGFNISTDPPASTDVLSYWTSDFPVTVQRTSGSVVSGPWNFDNTPRPMRVMEGYSYKINNTNPNLPYLPQ